MNELTTWLASAGSGTNARIGEAALGLLLAFIFGQATAWMYALTHTGLSYSKAFVQSIVLLTVIVSLGMMIIGDNIAIAFGLIGALAVIRFRNILKDTRDTAFIFFALVIGMATGTGRYELATLGAAVFAGIVLYLHWAQFGARVSSDGFVRFHVAPSVGSIAQVQDLLERHCHAANLISHRVHESGEGEVAYRLVLRNPAKAEDFIAQLRETTGISQVSFVLHEEQGEL
ncbi:MAG TPA: DUF4956 domain-containing protein [Candidatus Hydrogenedentes bacterium]|nr:DUF4956 domain-containing protein [Candidatus Hydrogenedentota bacterium]HOS03800.1 DUF4956 domain-containing protein [Candidatus Hydrogenedentota bacterium]